MKRWRLVAVAWIFLTFCSELAFAESSGGTYDTLPMWLAYISTGLVVLGIAGLIRLALLLQRVAVQVEHLQVHAQKVDEAFDKNTANHEQLAKSIRRVEDDARVARERIQASMHTPGNR
jgi:hypothetical protein